MVRRFFEAYPNTTLLNYNNASYPYWKCGIPPENSMNLVRAYDDGSLPWPGIMFGLTISSIWYWCSDQVSTMYIERGWWWGWGWGVLTMGDYRDYYSRRGGCSGGWDFFSTIWYRLKLFIWWLVLCFIIIHVYLTIISKGTMEMTSSTVSFHCKLGNNLRFPNLALTNIWQNISPSVEKVPQYTMNGTFFKFFLSFLNIIPTWTHF